MLERADAAVARAVAVEQDVRQGLEGELAAQRARVAAMEEVAPQRAALREALGKLDAALDDTRPARVAAMAAEPLAPTHLAGVLGEAPADPAGRAAWSGLAYRVEAYREWLAVGATSTAALYLAASGGLLPVDRDECFLRYS